MSLDAAQVADIEGTVATAVFVALFGLVVVRVTAPTTFDRVRAHVHGVGAALAAAVAVTATAGSLWFSEAAHFPPCKLCWYQRIAMYSLALILAMAAWRRDRAIRPYALALAFLGSAVSLWHNYIETFPSRDPGGCDPTNPCTIRWVEGLGFWTIPRMALVSFAAIIAVLALDRAPQEIHR